MDVAQGGGKGRGAVSIRLDGEATARVNYKGWRGKKGDLEMMEWEKRSMRARRGGGSAHLAVLALLARKLGDAEGGEDGAERVLRHLRLLPGLGVHHGIPPALALLRDLRHLCWQEESSSHAGVTLGVFSRGEERARLTTPRARQCPVRVDGSALLDTEAREGARAQLVSRCT